MTYLSSRARAATPKLTDIEEEEGGKVAALFLSQLQRGLQEAFPESQDECYCTQ